LNEKSKELSKELIDSQNSNKLLCDFNENQENEIEISGNNLNLNQNNNPSNNGITNNNLITEPNNIPNNNLTRSNNNNDSLHLHGGQSSRGHHVGECSDGASGCMIDNNKDNSSHNTQSINCAIQG
jgi:hypothetical protein